MANNNNEQNDLGIYKKLVEEYENSCLIIKKIEEDISNMNINNNQMCYLINLDDWSNFKEQVNFIIFKEKINEYKENLLIKLVILDSEKKEVKFNKLNNIIVNSIKELKEIMTKEKEKEYILINTDLSKDIIKNNEQGKYPCFYSFDSKELIMTINENSLHFELNKNIISIKNLKEKFDSSFNEQNNKNENNSINTNNDNSNNNNLNEMVNWLEKFYLAQKEFKNSLNKKKNDDNKKYGYLITIKDFDEWKNNLDYDFIKSILDNYFTEKKTNLLEKEKEEIKQKLKDKIIIKNKIPLLKFESMKELKKYNKIKSLILINNELINLINEKEEKENGNQIDYIISSEKLIEFCINNEKCLFLKSENKIHSNINSNLYLLIKIIITRKNFFKNKKTINLFIPKKGWIEEYKNVFNFDNLQQIIKGSNLINKNNENEKDIFNFIENISPNFINSIEEKISKLDLIKYNEDNNFLKIKTNENISFDYLNDLENIILDAHLIPNFCILNSIKIDLFIRIKTFFIKEKILIIFMNKENKTFGQIGEIEEEENKYIFNIDYLIEFKNNKNKNYFFNEFSKKEDELDLFYQAIYGDNSKNFFDYKLSNEINLSILNFKKIYKINQNDNNYQHGNNEIIIQQIQNENVNISNNFSNNDYIEKNYIKNANNNFPINNINNNINNMDNNLNYNTNNNNINRNNFDNNMINNKNNINQIFNKDFFNYQNKNQNPINQPKDDFNKIKNYLYIIISFFQTDKNIKIKINGEKSSNLTENLYLINAQWIKLFLYLFDNNNELYNLINIIPNFISLNLDKLVENILQMSSDNIKQYLNNLDYNNVVSKLTDNSILKIDKKYFNCNGVNSNIFINYYFLGENFCNILSKFLNCNITNCLIRSECFLLNKKIFSFFNDNNLYISNIGINYSFITERIIFYHNYQTKNEIINLIKTDNVNYFNYLLFSGNLSLDFNNIPILNLDYQNSVKNNIIIEKLKDFINFEIFKKNLINDTNNTNMNNKEEEVVLIRKDALNKIGYYSIISIINKYLQVYNNDNMNFSEQIIDKIIINLNMKDLQLLKQELGKYNNNINLNDILPTPDIITSFQNKNVSVYNDCLLIKKELIKLFVNSSCVEKKFIKKMISGNGINLIIIKTNEEKTILLGSIINKENTFNLIYIFNYKNEYELNRGVEKLNKSYYNYIQEDCLFEKDETFFSPIFDTKEELVGYVYKYSNNLLTNPLYGYYLCDNLKNVVILFNYYNFLNHQVQDTSNNYGKRIQLSPYDYCLVNKKWIAKFKKTFEYDYIISGINSGKKNLNIIQNEKKDKFSPTDKQIFIELKYLNQDTYLKYNTDLKNKYFEDNDFVLSLASTGYKDSQNEHNFFIPNDFEIMPKSFMDKYKNNDNNITEQNFSQITIMDSLFLIDFPNGYNGFEKYISLIGELDYNDSLEVKSIIVYHRIFQKEKILDDFNYNLRNIMKIKGDSNFISQNEHYQTNTYDECFIYQFNPNSNIIKNYNNNNNYGDNYNDNYNNNNNNDLIQVNEIEYDLDYKCLYPFINNNFQYPPLIGLDNIGATCYMNATLQCFCNIQQFVDYFKYDANLIYKIKNDNDKSTLSSSFKLLIEKLWPNNYNINNQIKSYSPYEFKAKISKLNPIFAGVAANDSKDLVNFIIMTLHEELNTIQNQINNTAFNLDQTNMNLMYNAFVQNFNANNNSKISDLFYALNYNITECQLCHVKSYNFQTYFFLIFPLEEIRKYKLNNNNNNQFNFNNYDYFNNNKVDIYDCFIYDSKVTLMDGQNMMYCNYCKHTCNNSMRTLLCTGPEILIIILNRGKGIEFKVKINFYEDLNLTNFISMPNTGYIYKLIGVITHMGESGMGGHFIAYCKNPINYMWNRYNDSTVTPVNDFKSEVIDYAMPYLLFYQKQY